MKKEKLIPINVKTPERILSKLRAKARRHAQGDLSAWLRHSGLNYIPKKGEVIFVRAKRI